MDAADIFTILIAAGAALAAALAAWFAASQALAAEKQADSAREQLKLANQVRQDQAQPYVFADIRPDHTAFIMVLIIENAGPTVARNVRVAFEPPLKSIEFPEVTDLLAVREGIAALPPGRRLTWYFDTAPAIFENEVPKKYRVTVDAEGPFGPVEQLEYEIDFNILKHSEARARGQIKDITEQLKKTNRALDTISRNIRPAR